MVYFNENDRQSSAWLKELFLGEIIDNRSIEDVTGADVAEASRVHLFAGVGGWELALRIAGWPDRYPVWTGSCPCQPFSRGGLGKGTGDRRHLWPEMRRLIAGCHPPVIFGEQTESPLGREWLAGVRRDLEALGYEVGAADLCAAGIGAPHRRQRIFWGAVRVGDADSSRLQGQRSGVFAQPGHGSRGGTPTTAGGQDSGGLDTVRVREGGVLVRFTSGACARLPMPSDLRVERGSLLDSSSGLGVWDDCDVLPFRRGCRCVESGSQPVADGISRGVVPSGNPGCEKYVNETAEARVMRLKGYGNAIVPQLAAVFIQEFVASVGDIYGES